MDPRAPQRGRGGLRALVLRRGLFGKQRQRCYDLHLSPVCVISGQMHLFDCSEAVGGMAAEMVMVAVLKEHFSWPSTQLPVPVCVFVIFVFILKIDSSDLSIVPTDRLSQLSLGQVFTHVFYCAHAATLNKCKRSMKRLVFRKICVNTNLQSNS